MIKDDVVEFFADKNVLVTGGTGLIGRQVVQMLCDAGARVKVVSLDKVKVHDKAEHIYGDLTHLDFCMEITKGMDHVFHMAGIKGSMEVSKTMLAAHFVPTLMFNTNVLEAARANKVEKLVYTSSIGAYTNTDVFKEPAEFKGEYEGPPMDFAGWAKRMGEMQIYAYKVQYAMENFSIVRPCAVYGPGDNFDPNNAMVVPSLMYRIHSGEDPLMVWGDGSAIRDFAYSRDVAEGVILALYHGTKGGFVNLGSGKEHSVRDLVEALNSFIDFNYEFDTSKPSGAPRKLMDISHARKTIGYDPSTSLVDGLKETWQWYLDNQDEYKNKKNYFKE